MGHRTTWIVLLSLLSLLASCQGMFPESGRHRGHTDSTSSSVGVVFDDDEDNTMPEMSEGGEPKMESCAQTQHGCCADGKTRAQGPDKEGCPEKNLVGGCAGTQFGCCMDGKTPAQDASKKGCPRDRRYIGGCAGTRWGCCLDKVTAARGADRLGCPEKTVVRCDMTQYGCCEDRSTAATGPDGAGCPENEQRDENTGCESSRYGCCPDGVTAAGGLNQEGCPSFDHAYCGIEKNPGNCTDYVLQWHFEAKYGMCRQFWYGGCGGNQNRFTSEEDCQAKCINVTGPGICRLPKVAGPCRASKMRYHFNARSGKCEVFTYGGCHANPNNFLTQGECEAACNGAVSTEAGREKDACANRPCQYGFECQNMRDGSYHCGCNPDWGQDCRSLPNYWCFSDDECANGFSCIRQKHCRDQNCYVYARCSVLSSRHTCQNATCPSNQDCVNDYTINSGYICTDKVQYKRPQSMVLNCNVHEFGCCPDRSTPAAGPNNERCYDDCRTSDYGCCPDGKSKAAGPDYEGCEFEGSADVPCERTDFGCCDDGVRAATGPRGQGCMDTTDAEMTTTTPHGRGGNRGGGMAKCTAPVSREKCTKFKVKWRYDSKLKACERHWWGGCQDNGNVFDTEGECESECITRTITEPTDEPTEDPDFEYTCDMPYVTGPCRANMVRYYHDRRDRSCKTFRYGGCGGNENNFRTLEECQRECIADTRGPATAAPATRPPQNTAPPAEATLIMSAPASVAVGSELRVTCITTGPMGLRLEWFFNGQPVTDENVEISFDRKRITGGIEATGQLIIGRATQENSGTYYCRNSERQTKSISVQVRDTVENTTPVPSDRPFESSMSMSGQSVVYEGTELRITCRARGPTDVGLEWFINGQPVNDDANVEVKTDVKRLPGGYEIIGELIIARAQMDNSGTYYCRSADRQIESMIINVRRGRSVTPRPTVAPTRVPRTERPDDSDSTINIMGDARVSRGSTLTITCRAEGPRRPSSIEWFINGRYVNPTKSIASISTVRDPRSTSAIVGTFSISNVDENNDGTYYCRSRPYGDIGRMSIKIVDGPVVTEAPVTTTTTTEAPRKEKGSPAEVCKMEWDAGNCYASMPRWFYDHQEGGCAEKVYGGCNGNDNNFMSERECNDFCAARDICYMPRVIGKCRAAVPRFYYDPATKQCQNFMYGGCDGNANNFAAQEACEKKCAAYIGDTTNVKIGEKEDVCKLDPEKGSCRGYNIKWYYSASRNRCARFVYTGCDGNGNRFENEDDCKSECMRTDVIRPTRRPPYTRRTRPTAPPTTTTRVPTTTITTTTIDSNVAPRKYSCDQPSDYGPCHDYKIKWYFNAEDRLCLRFYYGGCGGNDNRYETREECENICIRGIVPTVAPRTERPRPTPCQHSRYGCCNDGVTTALDSQRSNCPVPTARPTQATTNRPSRTPCIYSRFGCCSDGRTTAFDRAHSNCPENQGGSGDQSSVSVPIGGDAVLDCPRTNGEVSWYRDGFLLRSDSRFQIYNNGTLIVRRLSSDMAGNYACRLSIGNNIPELFRFTVSVNEPLTIVPGPAIASVKPGEDAFLHCQALGNPEPRVYWERDGRVIRTTTRHAVFSNGTLIISNVNFADEGTYICTAENGASPSVTRSIALNLKDNIEADIASHRGVYMEGDTITLTCRGEGYPPPKIEWTKEGKVIEGTNRVTVVAGNLMIRSASIEDAGMYKCTATNDRATENDYTTVQIKLQTPDAKCEDTMRRTKCHLIVSGRLCGFRMFANKCCESCRRAGYV